MLDNFLVYKNVTRMFTNWLIGQVGTASPTVQKTAPDLSVIICLCGWMSPVVYPSCLHRT